MSSNLCIYLLLSLLSLSQCKPLNNQEHQWTIPSLDRAQLVIPARFQQAQLSAPQVIYANGFQPQGQPQGQPGSTDYINQYYMYAVIKGYGEEVGRRMALAENVEKFKASAVATF